VAAVPAILVVQDKEHNSLVAAELAGDFPAAVLATTLTVIKTIMALVAVVAQVVEAETESLMDGPREVITEDLGVLAAVVILQEILYIMQVVVADVTMLRQHIIGE
jgi:hypothetical protein